MTEALIISNIVLWVVMLALLVAVIALSRQIGILYERIAPMGALMMDNGPKVGEIAPAIDLPALSGGTVRIGGDAARATLLFFLSPTCPVCKKLIPILKSMRNAEGNRLGVILASDGDAVEHQEFRLRAALQDFPYVLSPELGMRYRVSKLPYAVLMDAQGRIRAKGLVNSREQLESLVTAMEMGVSSVQEYLEGARLVKEAA